jgi:hypothetical protein
MRFALVAAAALTALGGTAGAGPFGLDMAMRLADIEKQATLKEVAPYQYTTSSLPNGHSDFNHYKLVITPQHGLCKVTANTALIATNVYGTQLHEAYERLFDALVAKYGKTKSYDFLRSGSIWHEPKDWTMALLKRQRDLSAFWTIKEVQLPDNLGGIRLEAAAMGVEYGVLSLDYDFTNSSACIAFVNGKKNSKL